MIRNFLAVMKDSFREAVDGFVIYIMIALAFLTILVAASVSFVPDQGDAAFNSMVRSFDQVFRNRGMDLEEVGSRQKAGPAAFTQPIPVTYAATDVQKLDAGTDYSGKYKFRLTVGAGRGTGPRAGQGGPGGGPPPQGRDVDDDDNDVLFRSVVHAWNTPKYPESAVIIRAGGADGQATMEVLPESGDADEVLAKRQTEGGRWALTAEPKSLAIGLQRNALMKLSVQLRRDDEEAKDLMKKLRTQLRAEVLKGGAAGLNFDNLSPPQLADLLDIQVKALTADFERIVGVVTDEQMQDFIRNQFLVHCDMDDVTVTRVKGLADKKYHFDVNVTVRPNSKGWPHKTYALFGAIGPGASSPLGPAVYVVQDYLVNWAGATITLLVAVILTGFFIPNMLRKGSLDLLVAKPMSRWELLLYKYLGGLIFMLLVTTTTVVGVWVALAVRSGNWNPTFLLSIPFITLTFAVLYAVSTLIAVLTRSAIAAILITCAFMILVWLVGLGKTLADGVRSFIEKEEDKQGWVYTAADVSNGVLPRYNDVLKVNSLMLREANLPAAAVKEAKRTEPPSLGIAIGVSVAWIAGLLGLAYLRFATRDP